MSFDCHCCSAGPAIEGHRLQGYRQGSSIPRSADIGFDCRNNFPWGDISQSEQIAPYVEETPTAVRHCRADSERSLRNVSIGYPGRRNFVSWEVTWLALAMSVSRYSILMAQENRIDWSAGDTRDRLLLWARCKICPTLYPCCCMPSWSLRSEGYLWMYHCAFQIRSMKVNDDMEPMLTMPQTINEFAHFRFCENFFSL